MDGNKRLKEAVGCSGTCVLVKYMPWHMNNSFIVPPAHALLYGMDKTIWAWLLGARSISAV